MVGSAQAQWRSVQDMVVRTMELRYGTWPAYQYVPAARELAYPLPDHLIPAIEDIQVPSEEPPTVEVEGWLAIDWQ